MGAAIFLIFVALGVLLSMVGGLIGLVDAFRVSPVWGLLSFFVPFALLVFCIKFWGSRKWAKISLITTLAGLLSMLAGVPFMAGFVRQQMAGLQDQAENGSLGEAPGDQVPVDQVPIEEPPTDQVPVDQVPIDQAPAANGDPEFATPMVPAAPQLANIASAELIQSTDPEERIRQINNRRPDPFATVPIPPPPPPPATALPTGAAPTGTSPTAMAPTGRSPIAAAPTGTSPTAPRTGGTTAGRTPTASRPGGTTPTAPRPGGGTAAQPGGPGGQPGTPSPGAIALAPLPALPQPTQAQQVTVTGVVTIGDRNYAIVQSPDEPTGRYVAAGQRVAGGAVLVKRIDMRGSEPVVVLEQNGVEVSHSVGVQEEEQQESPAAT
jgi:hypothetical protein